MPKITQTKSLRGNRADEEETERSCNPCDNGRFLAPLGMTAFLLNGGAIASHKIENGKWCVQSKKEEQREPM
jgi:hypothetical protein